MKAALGEPVSCVPVKRDAATTQAGWWLRTIVGTGNAGVAAVESSFSTLKRGREAEEERASDKFTEFDGYVPVAGNVLDPCAADNAFSVTELESAAQCPYRFFLKRGLGLRPVSDDERDKDVWLDPLTRGSELHACSGGTAGHRTQAAATSPEWRRSAESGALAPSRTAGHRHPG